MDSLKTETKTVIELNQKLTVKELKQNLRSKILNKNINK